MSRSKLDQLDQFDQLDQPNQLDQLDNVGVDPVGTVRAGQGGRETEGTTGRVQVESGKGGSVCKERVRGRGMESTNVGMGRKGRKKNG